MDLRLTGRARRRERSDRRGRAGVAPARRPLEALEARGLLSQVFTVTNTGDGGVGSLRWAIGQVEAGTIDPSGVPDQIRFNIPTSDPGFNAATGVWTIAPTTALPSLTHPAIINGYTQPGAVANTSAAADNAVIKIELAAGAPGIPVGLSFGAGAAGNNESTGVLGLAIHSFAADIAIPRGGAFVSGCFIGTDALGRVPASGPTRADTGIAVGITEGSATVIGGYRIADRNVIANCSVGVRTASTFGSTIEGNLIGTGPTGLAAVPNDDGIDLVNASGSTIVNNTISGNIDAGIVVDSTSSASITGNFIGTDVTGKAALGNGSAGVRSAGVAVDIGGVDAADRNVIAANGALCQGRLRGGIVLTSGVEDLIRGNSIGTDASATLDLGNFGAGIVEDVGFGDTFLGNAIAFNTALGIDLVGGTEDAAGVTANSPGGPHAGPNHLQNYPVLTSAAASATSTAIGGTLNSIPGATFTIQFFSNPAADPSGHGQGLDYVGSTTVVTDASGNAVFRFNAPGDLAGRFLSATATFADSPNRALVPGDTSEFSADIQATASSQTADLSVTAASAPSPHVGGGDVTDQFTITNEGPDDAQGLLATIQIPVSDAAVSLTSSDPGATIPPLPPPSLLVETSMIPVQVPALASGHSVTFTLVVKDRSGYTTSELMTVASLTPDPILTNNAATATSPAVFPTVTGLSVTPASAAFGQVVDMEAGFSRPQGSGGTMTFSIDGVPAATVPVTNVFGAPELPIPTAAEARFSSSGIPFGTHRITAHFSGNGKDLPSDSTPVTLTVAPAPTATILIAQPNPSAPGQHVTFTAGVASTSGAVPAGAVTFLIDGIGYTAPLAPAAGGHAAAATFSFPAFAIGTHQVTAHYNGSQDFTPSGSTTLTQVVTRSATVTALAASPNPATFGRPVTFTAVVAPTPRADGPTGAVTFFLDGAGFTVPLVPSADGLTGTASYTPPVLEVGAHAVVAVYNGDASFAPSASAAITEAVAPAVPPRLVEVLRFGYHAMPTRLAVVFDGPLDPASATDVANYRLFGPGGRPVPIVAAAAAPGGSAVVLQPVGRLNLHRTYHLVILGTPPGGVRGAKGAYLGSSPIETITARNLVRPPAPTHPRAVTSHAKPQLQAVDAVLASLRLARAGAFAPRRHR